MQENGPDATERDKDNDDKGNGIVNTKANGNENINENINTLENEHEQDMKKEEMIRRGLYLNTEIKMQEKTLLKRCMKHLRQEVLACESVAQVREIMPIQEKLKKWNATDSISRFAWDLVGIWERRFREKVCKELTNMGFGEEETTKGGGNESKKKRQRIENDRRSRRRTSETFRRERKKK